MATLIRIGQCLLKPINCARSSSIGLLNLNRIYSFKKPALVLTRYSNSDLFPVLVRNLCNGVDIGVHGEQVKSITVGTTLELLNSLNENHVSEYTTEQITSALNNILTTHYRQMYEEIPWLQANIYVASLQLSLHNILADKSAEVRQHEIFQTLWKSLAAKCHELSPSQVADCLLLGRYLGVERDNSVVHKLLLKLRKVVSKSDPKTLMTTSYILKALPGTDFILMQQVLNRFCEVMNTCSSMSLTEDEHYAMLHTACNIVKYLPSVTRTKLYNWLLDYFKENKTIVNTKQFEAFMRLCKYFKYNKRFLNSFMDVINSSCRQVMDETTPASLAEICSSLRHCRLGLQYDPELAEIIDCRVLELLNSNLKLCDVSNLFVAVSNAAAPNVVQLIRRLLHSNLSKAQDVDCKTLLDIVEVLMFLNVKKINSDFISLVQHRISLRANKVIRRVNSRNDILRLLLKLGFVNAEDETRFINALLKNVKVLLVGKNKFSTPLVTRFLLQSTAFKQSVSGGLPNEIVRCLLNVLPDLLDSELTRIIVCAKRTKVSHHPQLRQQVSLIDRSAQVHLTNKLNDQQSLQHLLNLMSGEIDRKNQQESVVSDKPLPLHPYFGDRNVFLLMKAVKMFKSGIYHLPKLYDQLAVYLIEKNSVIRYTEKLNILELFATTGHIPNNLPGLMDVAVALHERFQSRNMFVSSLRMLVYLSKIEMYPDDILSKLFTLKEIQSLERKLEQTSKLKPYLADKISTDLMTLNRSVVLECPHLDVPWIHEDYCLKIIANEAQNKKKADKLKPFRDEVEQAAAEVLGGSQYMRCSVHSPYYHMIDIECALTPGRMPVRSSDFMHAERSKSKFQRIAVCILPEDHYCFNSKHLIGEELVRKRHLEILEYKYVEVPHFDWYSPELSKWKTKVEYLRVKLN